MRSKRALRAPFVVTVTTVALTSVGCAASTTNGECPSSMPAYGSPCAPEGFSCNYTLCTGVSAPARCVGGRWQSPVGSCNPPFYPDVLDVPAVPDAADASVPLPDARDASTSLMPDAADVASPPPDSFVCPPAMPMQNAPCASDGANCGYGDCFGSPNIYAMCTGGAWNVLIASCNPPFDAGGPPPVDASGE